MIKRCLVSLDSKEYLWLKDTAIDENGRVTDEALKDAVLEDVSSLTDEEWKIVRGELENYFFVRIYSGDTRVGMTTINGVKVDGFPTFVPTKTIADLILSLVSPQLKGNV